MSHLLVLPILVPMITAITLLFAPVRGQGLRRGLSLAGMFALLVVVATLVETVLTDGAQRYRLGDWPAQVGIVLVADRASALLLALTGVLATAALVYACRGEDGRARQFHALFHFQLMGLNGAFLTGDLFNLFVFFEILLIASYTLLLHGAGKDRTRAALHYVILNLAGSSLFLIALGMLYAGLGTLNMADAAGKVAALDGSARVLVHGGGLLLLVVFGLKAALLPLYFWLPRTYGAAAGSVAALFAIMTKVGVYAMARVFGLLFGDSAGPLSGIINDWLWPLAMATLALAAIGVLSATYLRTLVAWTVVLSAGTLLTAVAWQDEAVLAAALYYLVHTTLVTGLLFLLVAVIRGQSGDRGDGFTVDAPRPGPGVAPFFLVAAMITIGLPPLSGFAAKVGLLQSSAALPGGSLYWWLLLLSSLLVMVAFSRAGTSLFWRRSAIAVEPLDGLARLALMALTLVLVLWVAMAEPLMGWTSAAATDLLDVQAYRDTVLGKEAMSP